MGIRLDSDSDQKFFDRELDKVLNGNYDVKYGQLKARTLIPTNLEQDPGAETIRYEQYDQIGAAKIVESYAKDFPRVDVKAKRFFSEIVSLGDSYGYSVQEARAAAKAKKPLSARKASVAKRAIMEKENALALFGDAKLGFTGLLNNPNVTLLTSGKVFQDPATTVSEIIAEINRLVNTPLNLTEGIEQIDTVLMDIDTYTFLSTTRMGIDSTESILGYIMKANPMIKNVEWLQQLKTADALGTGKRMMAYKRSPEAVEMHVPVEFEQFQDHMHAMEVVIHCHQRFGGVLFYYPLSAAYMDGI